MYWNDLDVNGGVSHLIQREAAVDDYRTVVCVQMEGRFQLTNV